MKKSDISIGGIYTAKVSNKLVQVRIEAQNRHGGWDATNLATGKSVRIKSAQRLRREVRVGQAPAQERCSVPRCRGEVAITHLGRALCQRHWDQVAAQASPTAAHAAEVPPAAPEGVPAAADATAPRTDATAARAGGADGKLSCLDAAVLVLRNAAAPMNCPAMISAMRDAKLWSSDKATPAATLYSAILREIQHKKDQSRFRKAQRGQFTLA